LPALTAVNGNGRDLDMNFLGYDGLNLSNNGANSHYNSLQVDLHGNLRNDLQYQFGYTYSRAVDAIVGTGDGGDLTSVTNPYVGWRYDVGPSPWDRTHIAFLNFVYQVPFLKNSDNHFLKTTIGGWALSGIITIHSGQALNLGVS